MRKSKLHFAIRVALVLAGALLAYSRPVMAEERSPRASAPGGVAVVIVNKSDKPLNLKVLENPCISGAALQIRWADIEPVEGKPDWSRLDELFAAAESSKKWVALDIFPGFFSPAWALEGATTDQFEVMYGPEHGTVRKLPMPWDHVYLDRWFAFLKQVSERYGKSPAFRMIAASGPTSVSEEMTLPGNSPPAKKKWLSDGYTPAKYLGAWEEAFHVYADSFPNQYVSLAAPGLPILEQGESGPPARMREKQDIVERAVKVFGRRLAIQSNDLHAGRAPFEAFDGTDFIKSYTGRIITGFEMRGGSHGLIPSKVMGAEGDPPLALRRSIDKGMSPNDAGRHVDFLEIYEGDVRADDMQPVLEYAASLFAPKRDAK
jgi:hypothetical protein